LASKFWISRIPFSTIFPTWDRRRSSSACAESYSVNFRTERDFQESIPSFDPLSLACEQFSMIYS
jgi:hypothetical protein